MYEFYVEEELLDVGFNIEEVESANPVSSLQLSGSEELYRTFFRKFIHMNAQSGNPIRLRETEHSAAMILSDSPYLNAQTQLGAILSMDLHGNVSSFSPELLTIRAPEYANFVIGNIWTNTIDQMFVSPTANLLMKEIGIGTANCEQDCQFYRVCGGGAPVNKFCETGTFRSTETMYCRLCIKVPIEETLNLLQSIRDT
jgi:uncharacterized protein